MDDTDSFPDRDLNIRSARVLGDPLGLLADADAATVAYLGRLALMFSQGTADDYLRFCQAIHEVPADLELPPRHP